MFLEDVVKVLVFLEGFERGLSMVLGGFSVVCKWFRKRFWAVQSGSSWFKRSSNIWGMFLVFCGYFERGLKCF